MIEMRAMLAEDFNCRPSQCSYPDTSNMRSGGQTRYSTGSNVDKEHVCWLFTCQTRFGQIRYCTDSFADRKVKDFAMDIKGDTCLNIRVIMVSVRSPLIKNTALYH